MRVLVYLLFFLALLAAEPQCVSAAVTTEPGNQALLSLVFPDVHSNGTAHKSVVIRNFAGEHDPSPLAGDMSINIFNSLRISNGAHADRLLVIDVTHRNDSGHSWSGETLLALFRLTPKPRLLDVADVRADRETYLWKMLYAPQHDGIIINATHLNTGEEFVFLELVEVKENKFVQSKVAFPRIFNATLGPASFITETPALRQQSGANSHSSIFTLRVSAKLKDPESGALKKQQSEIFSARLNLVNGRWQCSQCRAMQSSLTSLENRFGFRD